MYDTDTDTDTDSRETSSDAAKVALILCGKK